MHPKKLLLSLLILSAIGYSQYKSDFTIADSGTTTYFDFDKNDKLHVVWLNKKYKNNGILYTVLDSFGNIVYGTRQISQTIAAGPAPKLAINNDKVACVWEDKIMLDATFFKTFIIGKILKDGQDYSNEIQIDDGDIIPTDAHRSVPEIIWHNDSILYSVWAGAGSRTNSSLSVSDIYAKKLLLPLPLHKSAPLDYVLNNSQIKIDEILPAAIKQSSGMGYLAIWIEKDSVSVLKIAGVSCDDSLKPASSKIVFVNFDSVKYYMSKPSVFRRQNGNIILVWEKDTANFQAHVYFQEFTEQGIPVSEIIKVNDKPATTTSSTVADIDSDNRFIIVWEEWPNLMAQRFSSDMKKIGTNFKLNTQQTKGDIFPCVRLRNGKIYTAWTRTNGNSSSIWMNILDFNNPLVVVNHVEEIPQSYSLLQNYPNPFNPTTTIEYSISSGADVKIIVLDLLGRKIRTLVDEEKSVGNYKVKFDASGLSSGVYFYRLQTNEFVRTKRFILLR